MEGFGKEGQDTVRDDQTVAEMANEVLMRQAKARADRIGEPIEEAMEDVVNTEAQRARPSRRPRRHSDRRSPRGDGGHEHVEALVVLDGVALAGADRYGVLLTVVGIYLVGAGAAVGDVVAGAARQQVLAVAAA